MDYLYQQNYLWQFAISNYSGQFNNQYPKDPTIKILTYQAWILSCITTTIPLANTITVYTDGISKGRAGYIIYSPSGTCTEQINIATPGATVQHAEIVVVLAALQVLPGPVNIVSDSQYVVKAIDSIETARLKGDPNSTIFQLFTWAQLVIQAHTSPFFITHIHSHTGLPGLMAKGNQAIDQLISFTAVENSQSPSSIFQQGLQSHSLPHQSANMLHKQFPILIRDQCKYIIRACPTCSTFLSLGPSTGINPHGLKTNHIW
jgi:ribonuclease HI